MRSISFLSATALLIRSSQVSASSYTTDSTPSQFINFTGTVSASTSWSSDFQNQKIPCTDRTTAAYSKSYLYVGLNPPWDPNPFYFELYHFASDSSGGIVSFTDDDVYNLDFTTAGLACMGLSSGKPCASFQYGYYYQQIQNIDLTKAKISQTDVNGQSGYSVTGDVGTWVGNGSLPIGVDVDKSCTTDSKRTWSWRDLEWNGTVPFTYALTFSNASASLKIVTTPSEGVGSMTLDFTGQRNDEYLGEGRYSIELDDSDSSKPKFQFVNDTEITFTNTSKGWVVGDPPQSSASSSSTARATLSGSSSTRTGAAQTATGASTTSGTTAATGAATAILFDSSVFWHVWAVWGGMALLGAVVLF